MNWFISWFSQTGPVEILILPALLTLVMAFVLRQQTALDENAQKNTWATIAVYFANILVVWLFLDDLDALAQGAYDRLGLPQLPADFWDGVPLLALALIGIAVKDFVDYWTHRAMHTAWLWPTHAAHHSDTHVNAFTAHRIHFLEYVFMTLSYVVLLTWMQMPQAIPAVAAFHYVLNLYVHLDLDWGHGPFRYLLASPRYHRWHHADVPEAHGKNLANVIPLYDVMFGTYYNPAPCRAVMGARATGVEDKNPVLILIYPFQEWARLLRGLIRRAAGARAPLRPDPATRPD